MGAAPPLALGVDVGLTGVRACVVDARGSLLGVGRSPFAPTRRAGGFVEHSPSRWVTGLVDAARQALTSVPAGEVAAVAVSALGPAPVLVDRELRALTAAPLFSLDRRAERERLEVAHALPATERNRTFDHALPKLLWWQRNDPRAWARAVWVLDATGFLVATLTGVPTMDTITAEEYRLPGWDCPLPLPDPRDPVETAGHLNATLARELGLPDSIPVAAGSFDSFVDIVAAGIRRPGDAGCSIGSTLIVCQVVEGRVDADGLMCSQYPGEGVLLGGWTLSGCLSLDWARARVANGYDSDELDALAGGLEPGDGGLLALPFLAGERTPMWDLAARGALIGISLDTTPIQIYRAALDAVALSVRDHTERLAAVTPRPERWRAIGGGTANRPLLQAISDAVGAPFDVVAGAGDALGPALLALRMLGIEPTVAVRLAVEPDPRRHDAYSDLYADYTALYASISGLNSKRITQ